MKRVLSFLQFLIKSVLIIFITIVCYNGLNMMFLNKEVDRGASFHSLPENTLDIVVLGSSNAQYSFVPEYTYLDTGLYSYVLGSACQPVKVSYQMLKEALKTQKPKLVILEVYTTMPLSEQCEADSCYVIAGYQMRDDERNDTFDYLPNNKSQEYKNEFINNHNKWRTVESLEELMPRNENSFNPYKVDASFGFVYNDRKDSFTNKWFPNVYDENVDVELDAEDIDALNNILTLCKENDMDLLLYKTPIDSVSQEDQSYLHKVWQWADDNNVKYIDFLKLAPELGYYMCEYSDSIHAYMNGAGIITNYINNYITDNYEFNHNENDFYEEIMSSVSFDYTQSYLNQEYDALKSAIRVKNYDKLKTIFISDIASNPDFYVRMFENLGLEYQNTNSIFAIIYGDEALQCSGEPFVYDYEGNKFEFKYDGIYLNDMLISNRSDYNMIVFRDIYTYCIAK